MSFPQRPIHMHDAGICWIKFDLFIQQFIFFFLHKFPNAENKSFFPPLPL